MGVYHPRTQAGRRALLLARGRAHQEDLVVGRATPTASTGARRSPTTRARTSRCRPGLFRNQETYAFLEPQEVIRFREYWMPVRRTGGITRANPDAVLHLAARRPRIPTSLTVDLNVSRAVRAGSLRVLRRRARRPRGAVPAHARGRARSACSPDLPAAPRYTVEVADDAGRVLLAHTEDAFDMLPGVGGDGRTHAASRVCRRRDQRTDGDFVELGARPGAERQAAAGLEHLRRTGRKRFPESLPLLRGAPDASPWTSQRYAEARRPPAEGGRARDRPTPTIRYHLGLARAALGDDAQRPHGMGSGAAVPRVRAPRATLKLAQLEARAGERGRSPSQRVREALAADPDAVRAGRPRGRAAAPRGRARTKRAARLAHWRALDPTASILRYEAVRLGASGRRAVGAPRRRPGARAERRRRVHGRSASGRTRSTCSTAAIPRSTGLRTEPGAVAPQDHPEVAYYRGYAREQQRRIGRRGLRGGVAAVHALRVPEPRRVAAPSCAARSRPIPATRPRTSCSARCCSRRGARTTPSREWQEARRLDPRDPRPAPQPRPHAAAGERRRGGGARRLHGGRGRRPDERRPLPTAPTRR